MLKKKKKTKKNSKNIKKKKKKLENLKASNEREVINYIEEFFEITGKLSRLNIKLNNRKKINLSSQRIS